MKRNWNTENDRPMDMKENEDRMGRTLDALEHPGRFTKEELEELLVGPGSQSGTCRSEEHTSNSSH